MARKLFVGNIKFGVSDEDLADEFGRYGNVASARIMMDRETGQSRGFGFVEFEEEQDARAAMAGMNGFELMGRALAVSEARPMEDRRGGGGNGGGNRGGGRRDNGGRRYRD